MFSACVTSILRTYYTWKIVKSPDVSYHMLQMGLWTEAEISTGIIISCLPVIPKFIRHFGPKVYGSLLLRLKSTSNSRYLGKLKVTSQFELPSPKHALRSKASEYLTLNEYHTGPKDLNHPAEARLATARDDLERGGRSF